MAVKPQPWAYECNQCGWRKVVMPKSDCLIFEPVDQCPQCHSENISRVVLSPMEQMIENLVRIMMGR